MTGQTTEIILAPCKICSGPAKLSGSPYEGGRGYYITFGCENHCLRGADATSRRIVLYVPDEDLENPDNPEDPSNTLDWTAITAITLTGLEEWWNTWAAEPVIAPE